MSNKMTDPTETLRMLSEGDLSVLTALLRIHEGSFC